MVPASLSFGRVLVHTASLALFVNQVRVYPDGVELAVHVRRPRDPDEFRDPRLDSPFGRHLPYPDARDSRGADQHLRLGVLYDDGRAAQADRSHLLRSNVPPPLISYGIGGGGDGRWEQGVWIWGLPSQGSITVVYSWLAEDIPESSFVLDGQELRAAAAGAVVLWPASPDA